MRNFPPRLTLVAETDDTRNVNFRSWPADSFAHGPAASVGSGYFGFLNIKFSQQPARKNVFLTLPPP
jgi:hypothetical protein